MRKPEIKLLRIKYREGDRKWPETGFLRDTSLHCKDLGKNPVSLIPAVIHYLFFR
ncbi:hypothetical protein PL10110_160035 [Planktothrix agardhii]|nr:hypothetical protein PL10110_160035 [Planktothrix agardhii]